MEKSTPLCIQFYLSVISLYNVTVHFIQLIKYIPDGCIPQPTHQHGLLNTISFCFIFPSANDS
jgi:hypothetical protein